MTDIIYDYISMGVDMLITAAIISGVVVLLRSTLILNQYSANQQASSERINYYKEYNKYDCTTTLVTADVLSAMLYYRYDLQIYIKYGGVWYTNKPDSTTSIDGTIYEVGSEGAKPIKSEDFRNAIASNWQFKAYLYEDANAPAGNLDSVGSDGVIGTPSADGYQGSLITGLYFEATNQIWFSD